jgi:hypothetical protein
MGGEQSKRVCLGIQLLKAFPGALYAGLAIIAAQRTHSNTFMKFHRTAEGLVIDCSAAALLGNIIFRYVNNMPFDQITIVI